MPLLRWLLLDAAIGIVEFPRGISFSVVKGSLG